MFWYRDFLTRWEKLCREIFPESRYVNSNLEKVDIELFGNAPFYMKSELRLKSVCSGIPPGNYLFKLNNKNTRTSCEI